MIANKKQRETTKVGSDRISVILPLTSKPKQINQIKESITRRSIGVLELVEINQDN